MSNKPDTTLPARQSHGRFHLPLLLLLCAVTSALCFFLYQHDNKYTAPNPGASYGQMDLSSTDLTGQSPVWLVDGWELYGGVLLTPEDLLTERPTPDRYVYAGQLGGFESVTGHPYGSASYRLTIQLPAGSRTYALYLPELFSSCNLYINGRKYLQLGQPSPADYRSGTAEKIIPFEASGQVELLLAVSNFSNTYGGLTFPPALGTPDSIQTMTAVRLNLRTALLTLTLLIGIIALLIGLADRSNPLPALYALFCLLFLGYTCYPVAKTFFPSFNGLYLVENLSFCGMILMVFILLRKLFSFKHTVNTFGIAFGGLVCLVCVIYHMILPRAALNTMLSYSMLITVYKWLGALLLTVSMLLILRRNDETAPPARILLCGVVIFDCTLVMDRLLPLYEPLYSGWFLELSSLCLVLLIGAVILREIYLRSVTSLVLTETVRLTRQNLSMQREQHRDMMDAIAEERTFRHDLRHHISILHEFADADDLDALKHYFSQIEERIPTRFTGIFCENAAVDAILRHYDSRARQAGVTFTASVQVSEDMPISDVDLCVVFGNCLENAMEACERQSAGPRYINVSAGQAIGVFAVKFENSYDGPIRRTAGGFLSSKRPARGIGTASVQAIAKKYGGRADFETGEEMFSVSIFLHL